MGAGGQKELRDLAARIKAQPQLLVAVCGRYVKLTRRGDEYVGLSPFQAERTPSFTVVPKKGFYHCFSSGAHGSVIDFVMAMEGIPFKEAVERLAGELGIGPASRNASQVAPSQAALDRQARRRADQRRRETGNKRAKALGIWRTATPYTEGTPVEAYLRARGLGALLELEGLPRCLRYHEALPYWHDGAVLFTGPAMLAAIQGPDKPSPERGFGLLAGGFRALHVTWITPDGRGKRAIEDPQAASAGAEGQGWLPAKKIVGSYMGGAIRLSGIEKFGSGPGGGRVLAVSEGIESGLAARLLQRWEQPESEPWPVWAAASLSNIAGGGLDTGRKRRHPDGNFADGKRRYLPSAVPDLARPGVALPASVEEVVILADNDSKDRPGFAALLARAADRWRQEGRAVRVATPPRGKDWNDVLIDKLKEEKAA